jgi:chitodextrinase
MFINGTQVSARGNGGVIPATTNPLWIGGNQPYGEYFQGLIDDVRVYNRALTALDIQNDMNTPVTPSVPDTTPPSAPTGLNAAAASSTQVNLSWTAATDAGGIAGYRVERCAGASCTDFAEVGAPGATTFNDTGLTASTTYRYRVRAADLSSNLGAYSAIATATTPAAPDTTPPSAPTGLAPTVVDSGRIDLAWTASSDNVGVTGYRVERCPGASCTNFTEVGTPTGTTFSSTGLAAGTTYRFRVRAVDAATNFSGYSTIVNAATPAVPDTAAPSDPTGLVATANGSGQVDLTWTASSDNVGVTGYRVERCQGAGCTSFTQVGTPTGTSFSDTGLGASTTYRYRVRASDAALNLSGYSGIAEATTGATSPTPPGLVGAWGFGEGTGSTAADASGNGNTGTITSAAWSTQGHSGNALSFNGTSSVVRVAGTTSLNPGGALTMSAWIRPTASSAGWRTILARQADVYFLMAGSDAGTLRPAGGGTMGTSVNYVTGPTALAANAWTHVAVTYDGAMLRMFINGTQVSARANGGVIPATTNPLWIGGNQPYGEYFQGLIDDVRVYNRALTALDIQNDMNNGVSASGLAAQGLRLPSLLL